MFAFDFNKTLQVVAFFLRHSPDQRMNYTKLIKLVYIADRESLKETGEPITGDRVVAMENGPVLSRIYDLIKGSVRSKEWTDCIIREGYEVMLGDDPGGGTLCEYETEKLSDIAQRYADKTYGQMIDIVHLYKEWKKNDPSQSMPKMKDITLDDMLEALSMADVADRIKEEAAAQCAHAELLGQ